MTTPRLAPLAALLALCACGTTHETREVPRSVEYMPVDDAVLGFWVMQPDDACPDAAPWCVNDASRYGNDLVLVDGSYAATDASHVRLGAAVVGNALRLAPADGGAAALVAGDATSLSSVIVGETFAWHVRARTSATTPEAVISYGDTDGPALTVSLDRTDLVLELPSQRLRQVFGLADSDGWREIYLGSDGATLTLEVDCQPVASISRVPGSPILSDRAERLMVGGAWAAAPAAQFTGEVNVVRLSAAHEGDLFCPRG